MPQVLPAAGEWLVIALIVAGLISRASKGQRPSRGSRPTGDPSSGPDAELTPALQRAMETMRAAKRRAQLQHAAKPMRRAPVRAEAAVARAVVRTAPRPPRPPRPPALEDHAGLSQETEPQVVDYDEQALAEAAGSPGPAAPSAPPPIAPALAPARPAAANPLKRFGDGSLRGAIILSEILSPPLAQR